MAKIELTPRSVVNRAHIIIDDLMMSLSEVQSIVVVLESKNFSVRNLKYNLEETRYKEINTGIEDAFRKTFGYYQLAREIQEVEDQVFQSWLPITFQKFNRRLDPISERWMKAVSITRKIEDFLIGQGIYIVVADCRAKSNIGILEKMRKKSLGSDEVFDKVGIRLIVQDEEQQRRVSELLSNRFDLPGMEKYVRRKDWRHQAYRDKSIQFNKRLYRAILINLHDDLLNGSKKIEDRDILEVQIITKSDYELMFLAGIYAPYQPDPFDY